MNNNIKQELIDITYKYSAAIRQVETYIKILEEDYTFTYKYNPIDHISSRLKTVDSILTKAKNDLLDEDINEIQRKILDIAGIRIVCQFEDDVYEIVRILKESHHFDILKEKDYIKNPKETGYRSYHIIVNTRIHFIHGTENVPVEIQIRTLAMDFWANLEHELNYKYAKKIPKIIRKELQECSDTANLLDQKMLKISKKTIKK